MRRLTLILAVLVSLAAPAGAQAAHHRRTHPHHVQHVIQHANTNPETLALGLAEKYWGQTPCGGQAITITVAPTPAITATGDHEGLEEGVNAGATVAAFTEWDTPEGQDDPNANPSSYFDCHITMSQADWPTWKADDFEFQEYCDIMTHEVGHLFGHGDSEETNSASVTYPFLNMNNFNSVPECRGITLYYHNEKFRDESEAEVQCSKAQDEHSPDGWNPEACEERPIRPLALRGRHRA